MSENINAEIDKPIDSRNGEDKTPSAETLDLTHSPFITSITIEEARSVIQEEINRSQADLSNRVWGRLGILLVVLILLVVIAGAIISRQTKAGISRMQVEMATLHQAMGNETAVIELLDEALEAGIRDAAVLSRVGQIYYELEEYGKAVGALVQVVSKETQNEEIRLTLARSYGQAGQLQQAIAQYELLVELDPDDWRYYLEMGKLYEMLQEYDQALALYQKAAEIAPDRVHEGHTAQGELYQKLERYQQAIEQYQRSLEIDPDLWWVHFLLGQSFTALQEWHQAIGQYLAALELQPDNPGIYLEIGRVWRAQGEYEQALDWYEKALDLSSDHIPTLAEMGETYLGLGDCEQAVSFFTVVLEQQPNNSVAQEALKTCQNE